jgi:hypothetical protein
VFDFFFFYLIFIHVNQNVLAKSLREMVGLSMGLQ